MKMLKKASCLFLCIILTISMCGCGQPISREVEQEETPSMFIVVETTGIWYVVYHRDTKVMYSVSYGGYNCGNFTLLVNPDGSPMLWGE